MKKVLFTATLDSHILQFHIPYLKMFKEQGYQVHVATNEENEIPFCDVKHVVCFERNPIKINNLRAIRCLNKIIDKEKFDIIHCHTPMGGVVTRLAAKKARKAGTKVIYTAHGFHFFKGAPIKNWLIFYTIEKWLAKYTDTLITINEEDYKLAKRKFKKIKNIEYVHGIGLDTTKFDIDITKKELNDLRNQIEINEDNIILTYVAELNKNKNQILLIKIIENLIKQNDKYRLVLVGDGDKREEYQNYVRLNDLQKYVKFLGRRNDIPQILKITNIYVASSIREGLPVNILEAMYMGLPIIAMDNRGHRDLIKNKENGFLIKNEIEMREKIKKLSSDKDLIIHLRKNGKEEIAIYSLVNIMKKMKKIYKGI